MTTCPHGMPSPASCISCMDEGFLPVPKIPQERGTNAGGPFAAKYDGQCPGCNLPIHKGARVCMADTPDGRLAHHLRCVR